MGGGQDIQLANQGTATAPLNIHILGATATALRPSQGRHVWKKSMSGGGSTHYQRNTGHALLPGESASGIGQLESPSGSIVFLAFCEGLFHFKSIDLTPKNVLTSGTDTLGQDMLIRQRTTNDRDIVPMGANVNAGPMHPIFPDDVEALIGQDAVATSAIEAPAAEGTLGKSFGNRGPYLPIVAELQITLFLFSFQGIFIFSS